MHGNGFWLLGCRSFFEPLEMSQKWLSTQNELNDVMDVSNEADPNHTNFLTLGKFG